MNFRQAIASKLADHTESTWEQIDAWLEVPPQPHLGDFAFPCFRLARTMRMAPPKIASQLKEALSVDEPWLERIECVGGYLNFFLDRGAYVRQVFAAVLQEDKPLAASQQGEGKNVIVEFSSPNIAKPFHVGHAFTTILGHALANLYDRLGYQAVRMNHLGDYGTQFGKLIVAYRRYGDEKALKDDPIPELLRIYVRFHEEAKTMPELEQEAREAFRRLEDGCQEEKELWQAFRDLSLKSFATVYDRLGVHFDHFIGESFYTDKIPQVLELLQDRNVLEDSEGARIVRLEEENLPPCLIVKSDGTTIYASRDLAAILYRQDRWQFHKNLYVVGNPQALHFQQVFAVLKKAGVEAADRCEHVGFGLVKFPDRKLSTRSGDVIFLEDLLQESVSKTLTIIRQNEAIRNTDMSEAQMLDIAEKIGIGAIIYTFLKNGRERDIVFSWDEMLDFEGDSAPYVQYTYARARSILRKAEGQGILATAKAEDLAMLRDDEEFAMAKIIDGFASCVSKAAEQNEPYLVVRQVTSLARTFNKYYNHVSILRTEDKTLQTARLALVQAVCKTIKDGLQLVGIAVVERM